MEYGQITPKGVAASATMLAERGYLDEHTRSRILWFYRSGIGWENREFRRLWRKVQDGARQMLVVMNNAEASWPTK